MFERYTEQARRSIFFACHEASQFGDSGINTEHFLLALLREGTLRDMVSAETPDLIRCEIERECPPKDKLPHNVDLPLSHAMKRVLAYSAEEAEKMNRRYLGAGHLLLGLLREPCLASRILIARGIEYDGVRRRVAESEEGFFPPGPPMRAASPLGWYTDPTGMLADKKALTLAAAKRIAAAAEQEAIKNNWNIFIAIVDDGGNLMYLERMDDSQLASQEVSIQKARSALLFKRPTKALEDTVAGGRMVIMSLANAVPVEGGLPLMAYGKIVGAIGISGASSAQDGIVAKAGVDELERMLQGAK